LPQASTLPPALSASARRRPAREVEAGRGDQPGALRRGHALGRAAEEAPAAAQAHLGEHQRAALLGDQVDLAQAAAPVALDHAQARCAQQRGAEILGSRPDGVHGSLNGIHRLAVDRPAPTDIP
jgi:hypothetical protein